MLKQKLQADRTSAQKAKDQARLNTIRYIISQINNKEIALLRELDDDETVSVMQKIKKELNESIDSFVKGKRPELIPEYQTQLDIVLSYLPPDLTDEQIAREVQALISANKETIAKNPKAIIGFAMRQLKGKADPSKIQAVLRQIAAV